MHDFRENIVLETFRILYDFVVSLWKSLRALMLGERPTHDGKVFSLLHHVVSTGPSRFQRFPTAIAIGRAIFVPFVFLFSQKKPHESPHKDK